MKKHERIIWLFLFLIFSSLARAVSFLPVSQVRRDMPVHGLTVLQGTELTEFQGRVVDVLPQAIGTMSLVLVELRGADLEETGIIGGMSGSPVFFEDKLIGAVAYGWAFSKKPLAGITPAADIASLLPYDQGRMPQSYASQNLVLDFSLAPAHFTPTAFLKPLLTPMMVSGISPQVFSFFEQPFLEQRIYPVAAPSGSRYAQQNIPIKAGSVLSVPLITGDIDLSVLGTTTFCEKGYCAGFGHPLFNIQNTTLPAGGGYIHAVVPTLGRSFKLGSRGKINATLIQDAQQGVVVRDGVSAQQIASAFSVSGKTFQMELANVKPFFPLLYQMGLLNALFEATGSVADMTVFLKLQVETDHQTFTLEENFYASSPTLKLTFLKRLENILNNPFGQLHIKKMHTEVEATPGRQTAELIQFSLPKMTYRPGDEVNLQVALSVYPGKIQWKSFSFPLPLQVPKKELELFVTSGSELKSKSRVDPNNLKQWIDYFSHWYKSTELVIQLSTSRNEVGLSGFPLPSLPETILGILYESDSVQGFLYPETITYVFPTPFILSGKLKGILIVED